MNDAFSESRVLIIVGYASGGEADIGDLDALAYALSLRLRIPVQAAFLEASPSVGESIQAAVTGHHPQSVVVMPLFLGASEAKKDNVWMIVEAAKERWPDVTMHHARAPGAHRSIVAAYTGLLKNAAGDADASETALLVVGRGSREAENNAEVYHMARLLYENFHLSIQTSPPPIPLPIAWRVGEKSGFASVDVAFYGATTPDVPAAIQRCVQAGARRIIVLPYLLYEPSLYHAITTQAQQSQAIYPHVEIVTAPHLGLHDGIIEAVNQRYQEALTVSTLFGDDLERQVRLSHGHTHSHGLQKILPLRYQGGAAVSAAPMGAADLIFDAEGRVAWDEIWGSFCDLALAGGPPHRGTLLEPVSPEAVVNDPRRYQWVLAELERGIRMITKLPVITNASPGWIGVQCADEDMALWLLRAIVVENISIRREDNVLYFPAGPHFRLEAEIKNIITVVAKTHHYWTEHLTSKSQNRTGLAADETNAKPL
jgi:sirohydrochlorin cobaltochelatase